MDSLDSEMMEFQRQLEEKFRRIRTSVDKISLHDSRVSSAERPTSKASRRTRIMEARAFASHQYGDIFAKTPVPDTD